MAQTVKTYELPGGGRALCAAPQGRALGHVQLFHDQNEHMGRHADTLKAFAQRGYVAFGHDYPGHGASAAVPWESWGAEVLDQGARLYEQVAADFPAEPPAPGAPVLHALVGVGFGSTAAKLYTLRYPNVNALVLTGDRGPDPRLSRRIALTDKAAGRGEGPDPELRRALEEDYNQYAEGAGPEGFDWRTRDRRALEDWARDPMCNFAYPPAAYRAMLEMEKLCAGGKGARLLPAYLATYVLAGSKDPVNRYNRNLIDMIKKMRLHGAKNLFGKFYTDARHDLFFETNRLQVYDDVSKFLEIVRTKQLSAAGR